MIEGILKPYVPTIQTAVDDVVAFFPPGVLLSVAAGCVEHRKYWSAYVKEFIGTLLMVVFTFSAGKWIGEDDITVAWSAHAVGVVLADYIGGGQHVNPAVTVSMWALDKCSYTEGFVRIAGQMGGGLVAFPLFQYAAEQFNLTPFGGPEFTAEADVDAFLSEFMSTFLLMWVIYIVSRKTDANEFDKALELGSEIGRMFWARDSILVVRACFSMNRYVLCCFGSRSQTKFPI